MKIKTQQQQWQNYELLNVMYEPMHTSHVFVWHEFIARCAQQQVNAHPHWIVSMECMVCARLNVSANFLLLNCIASMHLVDYKQFSWCFSASFSTIWLWINDFLCVSVQTLCHRRWFFFHSFAKKDWAENRRFVSHRHTKNHNGFKFSFRLRLTMVLNWFYCLEHYFPWTPKLL